MSIEYVIHGWHKDGPVYDEVVKGEGFRGRRRDPEVRSHGKKGGRNVEGPVHHVVESLEGIVLLLNKGHKYDVKLGVDGTELKEVVTLDATDNYKDARLAEGLEVLGVSPHGVADKVEAAEDEAGEEE